MAFFNIIRALIVAASAVALTKAQTTTTYSSSGGQISATSTSLTSSEYSVNPSGENAHFATASEWLLACYAEGSPADIADCSELNGVLNSTGITMTFQPATQTTMSVGSCHYTALNFGTVSITMTGVQMVDYGTAITGICASGATETTGGELIHVPLNITSNPDNFAVQVGASGTGSV